MRPTSAMREVPLAGEELVERLPVQALEHHVRHALGRAAEVDERADEGALDALQELPLALEPREELGLARRPAVRDLHRDVGAGAEVGR